MRVEDLAVGVRLHRNTDEALDRAALFIHPPRLPNTRLDEQLGCKLAPHGILIQPTSNATNAPGVYAAGNVSGGHQVVFALASGARAAMYATHTLHAEQVHALASSFLFARLLHPLKRGEKPSKRPIYSRIHSTIGFFTRAHPPYRRPTRVERRSIMTTASILTTLFITAFALRLRHHRRSFQQRRLSMTWVIPMTIIEAMLLSSTVYAAGVTAALIIVKSIH